MKRAYAFILVLFLAVLLTGCGSSENGGKDKKDGSKVVCVMEEKRDEVTMKGTFVGIVDENDRITDLTFDVEGIISEDYYAQLKKKGNADAVMNNIEQGLRELPASYFGSFEYDLTSNTKNNKIYMTIELKLPDGHKDWGSKNEMLNSYSSRAEWTCEEK